MVATTLRPHRTVELNAAAHDHIPEFPTVTLLECPPSTAARNGSTGSGPPSVVAEASPLPEHAARMLVTRSVSRDGSLDAVSVRLELELDALTMPQMKTLGLNALKLETEIIETYFDSQASTSKPQAFANGRQEQHHNYGEDASAAVPATLLDIGKTKSNAYFINVKVGMKTATLFGSTKSLVSQLARAGLDLTPDAISENLALNFACRALTKPNTNGRYLQVVKLFPAA